MKITLNEIQVKEEERKLVKEVKNSKMMMIASVIFCILFLIVGLINEYYENWTFFIFSLIMFVLSFVMLQFIPTCFYKSDILILKRILEKDNNVRIIWHPVKDNFEIYTYCKNGDGETGKLSINAYIGEENSNLSEILAEKDENGNIKLLLPNSRCDFIESCEKDII